MPTLKTWIYGETVTAAMMNTELRDQLNAIYAGTKYPVFGLVSTNTQFSTSSKDFVDVTGLSINIDMGNGGTLVAFASGTFRGDTLYIGATVRLMIDGTANPVVATKSVNSSSTDISWVPFSNVYMKAVGSGTRTVKLQARDSGAGSSGSVIVNEGNIFVIGFKNP